MYGQKENLCTFHKTHTYHNHVPQLTSSSSICKPLRKFISQETIIQVSSLTLPNKRSCNANGSSSPRLMTTLNWQHTCEANQYFNFMKDSTQFTFKLSKKTTDISAAALQLHVQIYIISSPLCLQLATSAASDQKESSQLPMTNIKSPFSASRCPQVNLTSSRMIHSRPSNSKNALEVYSTL